MKRPTILSPLVTLTVWSAVGTTPGCGGRNPHWDVPAASVQAFGLSDAVAVSDPQTDRVLLLTTSVERRLTVTPVGTQRGVRTVMAAPDRSKLFIVSEGDGERRPPAGSTAQAAALEIVTRGAEQTTVYPLSEPLTGLALDPRGEWAVLYADKTSGALVSNPNELLLVNLNEPPGSTNPRPHTLRSFGGQPQRFTFTDPLNLPNGPRRLLVVETEQDVAILDLSRPADPEITIQLTSGLDTRQLRPAAVVVSDGNVDAVDDARIAIRLENDSTVITAQLVPAEGRDFRPDLNLTDVGGIPSDAAFVRTDGGALALAVLVPTRRKAVIIDPATSLTQDVPLPAAYQRLSLVTDIVGGAGGGGAVPSNVDVALLWGGVNQDGGVSFWELGRTAGQPYRSVETVGVTTGVTSVIDIGGNHPELKILGTSAATFFLLNLKTRTSAPFSTSSAGIIITPSQVGDRAWAHLPNTTELSAINLENLHPERMRIDRAISAVFEITATEAAGGNHPPAGAKSLVVWHQAGNGGVTVYDARPVDANAAADDRHNYSGILTEGLDVPLP